MERITGSEALGLFEAYSAVYAPQELTEEQVWEEVETWVNSLIEEGYDLSEYTWEEMYEAYIKEEPLSAFSGLKADLARKGLERRVDGFLRGEGPAPKPKPAVDKIPRVPAANPITASPKPVTAAPKVSPAPNPSLAAASSALSGTGALAAKPKPQSDISAMITRSQQRQVAQTPKPAAVPAPARPMGGGRERMLRQSFDVFDVIKGHLLDEGYADTEEAAEAIMVNMSEDWKNSIIG